MPTFSKVGVLSAIMLPVVCVWSPSADAADANLLGFHIKLIGTYTRFQGPDGAMKSAPKETRFLVTGDQPAPSSGGTAKLTVQPEGEIPGNGIPATDLIDLHKTYTVDPTDFKGVWTIDYAGAAQAGASSLQNLAGSRLKLRADFDRLVGPNGANAAVVKDQIVHVRRAEGEYLDLVLDGSAECDARNGSTGAVSIPCAKEGPKYVVKKTEFGPAYWDRTGWSYGPLFAPFKMRFKDKSLTGEAALGGYIGYEWRPFGISFTPAVHAGLSVVTVGGDGAAAQNVNDTTSKPAFTWGFALIMKPGENYQAGIILGKDRIGGSDGASWQYEGKWWLSVAIGYNFAR